MKGTLSKNKKELHHSLKQIDEGQKLTSAVKAHEMEPSIETRHHNHQGGHEIEPLIETRHHNHMKWYLQWQK